MNEATNLSRGQILVKDLTSGLVVFLVALPLCLGIALASSPPEYGKTLLFSGVLAGIIGGLVVGAISGSQTSVSGPAAGLTAVVLHQIQVLGSFEAFLAAVLLAGVLQIGMGIAKAGSIAAFFPTSVIKGLLAAIGVILILKQVPHLFGHDTDPEGEMSYLQPDHQNTFSELLATVGDLHVGAAVVGVLSLILLIVCGRIKLLDKLNIPAPLLVVVGGTLLSIGLQNLVDQDQLSRAWYIGQSHRVDVPVAESLSGFVGFLQLPDFGALLTPAVLIGAVTIALVASLETLLNVEAIDKLDPLQRTSPLNRELVAQGCGNMCAGLIGGLPVTSVIIRSSVNLNAGGQTKMATLFHGMLLLGCVALLPGLLNQIPLSSLAAILLVTGFKLASPKLLKQMWRGGWNQFIPFIVTLSAIVFTDLLIGILIGLGVALTFILHSNARRPLRRIVERHVSGDVLRIELANQVSFLNRASLERALDEVPDGGHVLLDARNTAYIDPDVLTLISEYEQQTAPARRVKVSLLGFRQKYRLEDNIQYVDYSSRDVQEQLTPDQVLKILLEGNERFRTGRQLTRNLGRQMAATAMAQYPLAVTLSCIDSRTPAELIFDLGLGDIFSVRVAGNVISNKVLGSIEYGCAQAGSRLVLVIGHTRCGAVTASVDLAARGCTAQDATGCEHLDSIVDAVRESLTDQECRSLDKADDDGRDALVDDVAARNVVRTVQQIRERSSVLRRLEKEGRIAIVGAMYDVGTGNIRLLTADHPVEIAE